MQRIASLHRYLFIFITSFLITHLSQAKQAEDLLSLDLESLMDIEIVSNAKRSQKLLTAPAAISVLTQEDIRRSGRNSLADFLRAVLGVHSSKNQGAVQFVSIRGFDGLDARKMLVLMDGRYIFNSVSNTVDWSSQQFLYDDIERIEIIRGPGSSIWGDNARNGVINIITKHANDAQKSTVKVIAGTKERGIAGRYASAFSDNHPFRLSGKCMVFDESRLKPTTMNGFNDQNGGDHYDNCRADFRSDWAYSDKTEITFDIGGFYGNRNYPYNTTTLVGTNQLLLTYTDNSTLPHTIVHGSTHVEEIHAGFTWSRQHTDNQKTNIKAYLAYEESAIIYDSDIHTQYLALDHNLKYGRHNLTLGTSYRRITDDSPGPRSIRSAVTLVPNSAMYYVYGAFFNDEISMFDDELRLTLGTKFEYNRRTHSEFQPTARLAWLVNDNTTLWASITKAINTQSRTQEGSLLSSNGTIGPLQSVLQIQPTEVDAEEQVVYELGMRHAPNKTFSVDATFFWHEHDEVVDFTSFSAPAFQPLPVPHVLITSLQNNNLKGSVFGTEIEFKLTPVDWWDIVASYSYQKVDMQYITPSLDKTGAKALESFPEHFFNLRNHFVLAEDWLFDINAYYTSRRPAVNTLGTSLDEINSHVLLDLQLTWRPSEHFDARLVWLNALDDKLDEKTSLDVHTVTQVEQALMLYLQYNI